MNRVRKLFSEAFPRQGPRWGGQVGFQFLPPVPRSCDCGVTGICEGRGPGVSPGFLGVRREDSADHQGSFRVGFNATCGAIFTQHQLGDQGDLPGSIK